MSRNDNPFPYRDYLHPKFWPTWLGLGLWWLAIQLPYPLLIGLSTGLGWMAFALLPGRRRITRTNIRLCFPDLDDSEVRKLVRDNFVSSTLALFESGLAWWGTDRRMKKLYRIEGLENLAEAEARGKGVLLLGGHYTTLEISGRFLGYHLENLRPTYKRAHNKLFEAVMAWSRRGIHDDMIKSRDMRGILRNLKQKKIVWYAPDQDFGMSSAVFAPFMGVQTATLTLTARIARSSGAPMLPLYSERLPGAQGYLVRFGPIVEDFPTDDDVHDATVVNRTIEQQVRRTPSQYLWGHRRFKTRPWGEPQVYKPRRGKVLRRYTFALTLLALPIVLYTAWVAIRNRDGRYFFERLGLGRGNLRADLHLHAASIGEFNAALPLLRLVQQTYSNLGIVITMNTPGGRQVAEQQLGDSVRYSYMPIDWQWAVARLMRRIKPGCVLVMETELWPNLFEYCYHHGIHLVIINGRLSARSLQVPKLVSLWQHRTIEYAYAILARSTEDAARFQKLGCQHVIEMGNIKYADMSSASTDSVALNRSYLLAASTRDGEEKRIVEAWLKLAAPRPLLVIVPRHIPRLGRILEDLKAFNLDIAVRSQNETVGEQTDIYLADTFGELGAFIAGAEFVIMGGSLEPFGGQNILEVARAGKAVIFGPHMDNFQSESADLLSVAGAIQVEDEATLATAMQALLDEPERANQLGDNGRKLIERNADMAERYLHELRHLCSAMSKD